MTLWARLSEKVSDNGPEVAGSLVGHHGVEMFSPRVAALRVFWGFLVFKFEGPIESWINELSQIPIDVFCVSSNFWTFTRQILM